MYHFIMDIVSIMLKKFIVKIYMKMNNKQEKR